MNRFQQKLYRFMIGRYGVDAFCFGLLAVTAGLSLVNAFLHSTVLSFVSLLVVVYAMFRILSRNTAKRRRENAVFLKVWYPVRNWFTFQRDRIRDRKTVRYRRCRHCRAILRLPNRKGTHTTTCPKCGERMKVHILI